MIASQKASTGSSSAGSLSVTLPQPVAPGSVLIVAVGVWTGLSLSTPPILDTQGNNWSLIASSGGNSSDFNSELFIFAAFNAAPGITKITVGPVSGPPHMDVMALEYAFGATASDNSAGANNNSATTGITTTGFSTSQADVLVAFGMATNSVGNVITMHTSGYSSEATESTDNTIAAFAQVNFSGTVSVNITGTGTNPLHGAVVAFKFLVNSVQLFPY